MKKSTRIALVLSSLFLVAATAAPAMADPGIYDWPDASVPVLVRTQSGIIFLSSEKKPWRAYSWKQGNIGEGFESFYAVDLNRNGSYEVVSAGDPVFLLDSAANPMWQLEKGCKQTMLGSFVSPRNLDIACNDGNTVKVYTYDGQFAWQLTPGKRIEDCRVGDHSGDLKPDLECKFRGSKSWVRVDSSGKVLVASTETPEIEPGGAVEGALEPVAVKLPIEKQPVDLSGSGSEEQLLSVQGNIVQVGSKGAERPEHSQKLDGDILSVLIKDLNNDGKKEIVALTPKSIYVIEHDGKEMSKFSTSTKSYKRKPLAKFESVYANYFADNDKAGDAVRALQDDLSKCYAKRVKASQFAGIGRLILKVSVDHAGKLKDIETVHSGINDNKIVECAKSALKKGSYPKAESDAAPGTINVNMQYTFWDE